MYHHILIPLDNSDTDDAIMQHILGLAKLTGARLTLLHVADGFMAQNQKHFDESAEMKEDRAYLERRQADLAAAGFQAEAVLLCGEPAEQIDLYATTHHCDLIAMSTHGHKGLTDIVLGSVIHKLRHRTTTPLLLVRGAKG